MTYDKIVIDGIIYRLIPEPVPENLHIYQLDEVHFPKIDYQFADKEMTWPEAVDYAKNLGPGWTLPTKEELQAYAPQLSKLGNKNGFWSLSTLSANTTNAWVVDLANGYTYGTNKYNSYNVVCVRP